MVRCGCGNNACACVVSAGSGITVTGTGAPGNAYVVSTIPNATNPPHCAVRHSVNQSHATNGAWQALVFDTEDEDTNSMHSTSVNTSRITVPINGIYLVSGGVVFAADADGQRAVAFRKNSSGANNPNVKGRIHETNPGGADAPVLAVATVIKLAATDYIELVAFQNSGAALTLLASTTEHFPYFTVTWMGLG